MQKTMSSLARALATLSFVTLAPGSLLAQSIWFSRNHDKMIAMEFLIPNFKEESGFTSGWASYLSVRAPVSNQFHFVGEIPFVHGNIESSFLSSGESQSTIGNPYLGLEIGQQGSRFFAEIGARAPLISEDNTSAALVGIYTDFDRFEAFLPNTVPISAMLNYYRQEASGFVLRLRGGPSLLLYTDASESDDKTDWFLSYSAQAGYESQGANVMGGILGRANLSSEAGDFGERSVHQLGVNASMGFGRVRPGIHVRLPLDSDLKESLDFVFGFNLGIQL